MTTTPELIQALAASLTPVRRLRPPIIRAAAWLLLAAFILVLIGIGHGVRPNLALRLQDWTFVIEVAGALLTGVLAALAAFLISLPDRSRWWALLPVPPFALWMASIGRQCLTDWIAIGPDGMKLGETAECLATLGLTSLPLSLALLIMLRHAAPLRPANVILLGSLAVAGISATALSLFHPLDASAMILMFNVGTTLLFVGCGGVVSWLQQARS